MVQFMHTVQLTVCQKVDRLYSPPALAQFTLCSIGQNQALTSQICKSVAPVNKRDLIKILLASASSHSLPQNVLFGLL